MSRLLSARAAAENAFGRSTSGGALDAGRPVMRPAGPGERAKSPRYVAARKRRVNPIIQCACGCGAEFREFDYVGRRRRYVNGHFMRAVIRSMKATMDDAS